MKREVKKKNEEGGGEGGRTNEKPGTDHVTSGPIKGLEKTATDGTDTQTSRQTSRLTWQLYG